ncbi:hypothetical protein L226DRAFT_617443 [Lentinus tigrinus ALCF2SS1-7]|uniref:uncharacterized protein n=1 Tax=Lentinus tigrinus ALCF2SS1-7 TaxID=1328758 RepID=UPI00116638A6|nr:hypothetical protein L226DRAFT_617443 [Lentinus tigrinus ALCF2SS1-7]
MSSDTEPDTTAIAEAIASAIANYCVIAGIVFLLYEYSITFGREVDLFWTRRFTGATALFLANKYITLLNHLIDLSLFIPFHVSDKTCVAFLHSRYSPTELCESPDVIFKLKRSHPSITVNIYHGPVPFSAIMIRALALCKSWLLSVPVFVLLLVPLGANFSVKIYGVNDPAVGCGMGETIDPTTALKYVSLILLCVLLISRTCLIVADVLLIVIILWRIPRHALVRAFTRRNAKTLLDVLYCHGIVYFLVLLILNTLHIVFSFTSISEITYFTEPLTAVLVSRFLMDIQEASQRTVVHVLGAEESSRLDTSGVLTQSQSIVFARIVSSVAAPIPLNVHSDFHSAQSEWSTDVEAEKIDCEMVEAGFDKNGSSRAVAYHTEDREAVAEVSET